MGILGSGFRFTRFFLGSYSEYEPFSTLLVSPFASPKKDSPIEALHKPPLRSIGPTRTAFLLGKAASGRVNV